MERVRVEGALVSDEPTAYQPDEPDMAEEETHPHRSMWTLVSILLLVIIALLALLMFRGCAGGGQGLDDRGGKTIGSVDDAEIVPGVVSIWVEEPAKVGDVLKASGVSADSIVDLGEGRYLIVVSTGLEDETADRIAEQEAVYDVGRVYEPDAGN